MRRLLLVLLCLFSVLGAKANHWTPDPYQFANSMNVIGVIEINGQEQATDALELGAFCGSECRGSEMLTFFSGLDRYMVFLTIFGEAGNTFSFQLYDHNTQQELLFDCEQTIQFVANEVIGNVMDPYVFSFTGSTCVISVQVEPEMGGVVTGDGTFMVGETCTLTATPNPSYSFYCWSENDETVSTDANYTFVVEDDRSLVAHFIYYEGLLEQIESFSVFPNPTDGMIQVEVESGTTLRLFDMNGRLLKMGSAYSGTLWLDLGPLPVGCYFLQMGNAIKKVLKR